MFALFLMTLHSRFHVQGGARGQDLAHLILFFLLILLARLHEVHRAIAVTSVVHVPVPIPVRVPVRVRVCVTLVFKFSRSPYLDNHSSESIHTWTIDNLWG